MDGEGDPVRNSLPGSTLDTDSVIQAVTELSLRCLGAELERRGVVPSSQEEPMQKMRRFSGFLAVAMVFAFTGIAAGSDGATVELGVDGEEMPAAVKGFEGVERNLYRDGRVYLGGQPSEDALGQFKELGVTVVVNLRTPGEMEDRERVPFDEAEVVEALGLEYVWIPLGGEDHPYTPAAVDRFAEVMRRHDGAVLVHCTMGWRVAYLWVAYLIREHGFELDDALARGEAVAIGPSPLEGLLDRPLDLAYAQ
jgi:protein tyrosine phosphatase (PTP) superfamily phosphohydrolase (DUF442 family)